VAFANRDLRAKSRRACRFQQSRRHIAVEHGLRSSDTLFQLGAPWSRPTEIKGTRAANHFSPPSLINGKGHLFMMRRSTWSFIWYLPLLILSMSLFSASLGFYFSSDDLFFLINAQENPEEVDNLLYPVGRWLNAELIKLTFRRLEATEDLVYMRFLSAGFLVVFSVLFGRFLRSLGAPHFVSTIVSTTIFFTPSTMPIVAWGQHWTVSFAYVLTAIAFIALVDSLPHSPLKRALRFFLSTALLYLAASINQQTLGVCALFIFCISFYKFQWRAKMDALVLPAGATVTAYILAFLTVKFGVTTPGTRAAISLDFVGKFNWFTGEVLPNAFHLWGFPVGTNGSNGSLLHQSLILLGVACLLWAMLIVSLRKGTWGDRISIAVLGILCLPLSYAPALLATENWASYRNAFPLQLYVFSVILIPVLQAAPQNLNTIVTRTLVVGIPLITALNWLTVFERHMRTPYEIETNNAYKEIRHALSNLSSTTPDTAFHVIYPQWNEGFHEVLYYDDIGGPIVRKWTVAPLVRTIYRKTYKKPIEYEIIPVDFDKRGDIDDRNGVIVIDLSDFAGRSLRTQ
jgi:hypothetical protein